MTGYMHTLPRNFQAPDFLPIRLLPHADEAKYFVSQIVTKTAVKDTDPWGCVRLHHDFLRRVMDKDCIAPIVNALQDGGVIEVFAHCKGIKCKGYRMTARYTCVPSVRVPAIDPRLIDRIERERQRMNDEQRGRWLPVHRELSEQQVGLTITDDAEAILDALPSKTRDRVLLSQSVLIDRIRRRKFHFSVGSTGRCFNNLCNLKRELRAAVRLYGEPLGNVDIRCSQLALLGMLLTGKIPPLVPKSRETYEYPLLSVSSLSPSLLLLPAPCHSDSGHCDSDTVLFAALACDGCLNDRLLVELGWPAELRDRLKRSVLRDVLAQRGRYSNSAIEAFRRLFPSVYRSIRRINQADHGELIRLLQRIESWLVIETVVPRLIGQIPIVTLHDAIYSRRRDVAVVKAAFEEVLDDIGFRMSLKCE